MAAYGWEATRAGERGLPLLAGVGAAATASVATSIDFAARRVLRLGLGVASDFSLSASGISAAAGVGARTTCVEGLRPSPRLFASSERRFE